MILELKYGDFECNKWTPIIGIEDIRFRHWAERIRPYLVGYELWVYGGILEGWETNDIDGSIIGPYNPNHINWMLENICRITLEEGLFPDIKYSIDGKLFKWSDWSVSRETVTCKYAYYRPNMVWNGKSIEWGSNEDGLWVSERIWPMKKQMYNMHNYKDPVKLF